MLSLPNSFYYGSTLNQDVIVLVHLYYDASNYLKFSTEGDTENLSGYIPCLDASSISWSAKWDIAGTNEVTKSVPEIVLYNDVYTDNSDSVVSMLMSNTYIGGRAVVMAGYKNHTIATGYFTIYDGKTDDIRFDGDKVTLTLINQDLPATPINGRKINNRLIGTDSYSITVPEESDGRYLPVPFGNQWNAPCVLYRGTEGSSTYWSWFDNAWHADFNATYMLPLEFKRDNNWSSGAGSTQCILLIPNDGQLVPLYERGYTNSTNMSVGTDGSAGSLPRIEVAGPEYPFAQALYGQRFLVNVPLRLYRDTTSTPSFTNTSPTPGASDIDSFLNSSIASTISAGQTVDGTTSRIIFNAILDFKKQLRSFQNYEVNPNWPIHIPQPDDPSEDAYTMLMLGVFSFDRAGTPDQFKSWNRIYAFNVGDSPLSYNLPAPSALSWMNDWIGAGGASWANYLGVTWIGRGAGQGYEYYPPDPVHPGYSVHENGGQDTGYHYYTNTLLHDAGVAISTGNELDLSVDRVDLDQVADAGNLIFTDPDDPAYDTAMASMMDFPFLRRNALDLGLGFWIHLAWDDVDGGTADVAATFKALYLEAFEDIAFDWSEDKYTQLRGWVDNDYVADGFLTFPSSGAIAGFADETYRILEVIIRRKLGVAASSMNTNEWTDAKAVYGDMFGSDRTGSGFVTPTDEELPFNEFIKEYCKYEPFTVYIDTNGKYRYLFCPVDRTSFYAHQTDKILGVDYTSIDTYEFGLTDKKWLCSQIDNCATDRIYFDESYVENHKWAIPTGGSYSFSFWDKDNSSSANMHRLESLEKKFTSCTTPSRVANASDSTKGYCCLLSNEGTSIPLVRAAEGDIKYWQELSGSSSDWGTLTSYTASGQAGTWIGWDSENRAVAGYWLNQWCNRHRTVKFTSRKSWMLRFEVGDFVTFSGFPDSLLGLNIGGFNGSEATSATVNGQTVYDTFIITSIVKSITRVEIECMQLHNLGEFIVNRDRRKPRNYITKDQISKLTPKGYRKHKRARKSSD